MRRQILKHIWRTIQLSAFWFSAGADIISWWMGADDVGQYLSSLKRRRSCEESENALCLFVGPLGELWHFDVTFSLSSFDVCFDVIQTIASVSANILIRVDSGCKIFQVIFFDLLPCVSFWLCVKIALSLYSETC